MLVVVGSALIVFLIFLIFSKMDFMMMILLLVPVIIFGFYLNYDVRKMVSSLTSNRFR